METISLKTTFGSHFSQIAWVVKDVKAAETFFNEVLGIGNFVKLENLNAKELNGTFYDKPADFTFHLYMAYSGNSLIELIQPVSGQSIFHDYLEKNPSGGVQHIAYSVPFADLDKAIAELKDKGYPVITSLHLPVAKVAFFDTYKELGVSTEIIGLTAAGEDFVDQLKTGAA